MLFIGLTLLQLHIAGALNLDGPDLLMVVQSVKENGEIPYYDLVWIAQPLETVAVAGGENVLPRTCKKEVWDSVL